MFVKLLWMKLLFINLMCLLSCMLACEQCETKRKTRVCVIRIEVYELLDHGSINESRVYITPLPFLFWYYNKITERGILSTKLFQTLTINFIYFRSHIISTSFLRIVFSKIPFVIINTVRFTASYIFCALLPEFQREEPAAIAKVMDSRLLPPCW